jgi:hypothetical protein
MNSKLGHAASAIQAARRSCWKEPANSFMAFSEPRDLSGSDRPDSHEPLDTGRTALDCECGGMRLDPRRATGLVSHGADHPTVTFAGGRELRRVVEVKRQRDREHERFINAVQTQRMVPPLPHRLLRLAIEQTRTGGTKYFDRCYAIDGRLEDDGPSRCAATASDGSCGSTRCTSSGVLIWPPTRIGAFGGGGGGSGSGRPPITPPTTPPTTDAILRFRRRAARYRRVLSPTPQSGIWPGSRGRLHTAHSPPQLASALAASTT